MRGNKFSAVAGYSAVKLSIVFRCSSVYTIKFQSRNVIVPLPSLLRVNQAVTVEWFSALVCVSQSKIFRHCRNSNLSLLHFLLKQKVGISCYHVGTSKIIFNLSA